VLSDSLTTAGVLVGLAIIRLTGWLWVDAIVAIVIAVHLLRVGIRLLRHAVANLMDQADPTVLTALAQALERGRTSGWVEIHRLRSWRAGETHHVDFHLTLPRFWDLQQAHDTERNVVDVVRRELDTSVDVIVHLDPCVPECCGYCDFHPCPVRGAPFSQLRVWDAPFLVQSAQTQRSRDDEPG
jgi:cation diffusion facilitator family transporter